MREEGAIRLKVSKVLVIFGNVVKLLIHFELCSEGKHFKNQSTQVHTSTFLRHSGF